MAEVTTTITFNVELTDIRRTGQLTSQEQIEGFIAEVKKWLNSEVDDVHISNVKYKNFVLEGKNGK